MEGYTLSKINWLIILISIIFFSCSKDNPVAPENTENLNPFEVNRKLGRGINLGNMLEAPSEGAWGFTVESEYFKIIKDAGFNSVRVPIKWSAHAEQTSPYKINEMFFDRIDWVIENAFKYDLLIIINIHHYDEIMTHPEGQRERFLALWKQISSRYKNYSYDLLFEVLNEPNAFLTPQLWNDFLRDAITTIRSEDKHRTIIAGTADWGGLNALHDLKIPQEETNLIITFHYYSPFQFTHQGAEWVSGSDAWLGTTWSNTNNERDAVILDFNKVLFWAESNNRPLNLGEFGAYSKADMTSRVLWTAFVSQLAVHYGFSFHYWEFCAGFGVYDTEKKSWQTELLKALLPDKHVFAKNNYPNTL